MTWFWIYKNDSWYYTFSFDANDLFDFTREMDDWFGWDISCVKLIMPDDEVDVAFKNALSESPDDDKIIKEFLDKINW